MKRLIVFLLLFAAIKVAGQTTGYLRFDTVRIYRQGGTAELVLMNKTKDTIGLLTNVGNGLTRFVRSRKLNDSTFTIGLDTISLSGGAGTVNLDSLRNATQLRIVNGLDTTIFESATTSLAGAFPATDKVKVNRWEPYLNFTDLRAKTNIDTSVIYTDKNQNWFRYDPTDASTADDSSSTIVVGSARLKRVFNGIYRPEDFGAKGDGTTNDWWAWQKMMNYIQTSGSGGMVWCDSRANYRIDTTMFISLPQLSDNKILTIHGNGAKMTGKRLLQRRPPNQSSAASSWQGVGVIIRGFQFVGSGGGVDHNAVAIDLGATYGTVVEKNTFSGFDTCIVYRFCLNGKTSQNLLKARLVGIAFTYGDAWGGNNSNSQSNGSISDQDRIYGTTGGDKAVVVRAASDVQIRNIIIEGSEMDYGVWYDNFGATVVKGISIDGAHVEYGPGGPNRAAFYINGDGVFEIKNIYIQVCDTFLVTEGGAKQVYISSVPFWPASCKIAARATTDQFELRGVPSTFRANSTFFAVGGVFVLPPATVYTPVSIASNSRFDVLDATLAIGFAQQGAQGNALRVYGGRLIFNSDNTQDIGLFNSFRARDLFMARHIYTDTLSGNRIGWMNSVTGVASAYFERISLGHVSISGTGGFKIQTGTTAQRPSTSLVGTFRLNSDTTAPEIHDNTDWRALATRNWTRLNFATFSQIAAQIHDSLGTSTTVVREPVVVIDGGTDPDTITIAGLNGFGSAGQLIRVNSGATGLEYFTSSAVSSPYIYQFVSTQQITVTNTVTATTIYGTGTGSASVDGTANVTTGTKITLRGSGEIDTDASAAGDITFSFVTNNNTLSIPVTGLANALADASYDYEYTIIPLGTGATQDAIYYFNIHIDNNGTPLILKGTGRVTGAFTTTGTWATDVTVEWSAADTDNTVVANFNTVEIFKK